MAIRTYVTGKLTNNGTAIGGMRDGSLAVDIGTEEVTKFSATWRDHLETVRGWTIQGSCAYNPADTAQAALRTAYTSGTAVLSAIAFWEDASHYFGGSGILTNATVSKSVGSPDRFNFSILGKTTLSYT